MNFRIEEEDRTKVWMISRRAGPQQLYSDLPTKIVAGAVPAQGFTCHRNLCSMGGHGRRFLFPNVSMMGCQPQCINRLLMLPSFLSHVHGFSIG